MNTEQRSEATRFLGEGCTFEETAALCGVPLRTLSADFLEGRRLSEAGADSELADWYLEANAARHAKRAELRARADATLGSRESQDAMSLLAVLQQDEPYAPPATDDVRERSLFLDSEDYSPELQEKTKTAALALHDAFSMMLQEKAERRRVAA